MTYAYGKNILPLTVGFDRLLSTFEEVDRVLGNAKPSTFPPYNIIKVNDYNYDIDIAVAGFSAEDIDVETKQNKLVVSGSKPQEEVEYLHHGLATRDFKHIFTLSDISVVKSADICNGILKIRVENIVPEEQKPRKIPILTNGKELLIETFSDK